MLQPVKPRPTYAAGYSTDYDGRPDDDDEYGAYREQVLMRSQDEQLDDVSHTVGNLHQQAREMGEELDDQAM